MKITLTTLAVAATLFGAAALAHKGATGVVKERMDAMGALRDAVKAVAPMMTGETTYDAETVRQAAATMQRHSGSAMTELFPEGTNAAPSESRDVVWSDWETFVAMADQLDVYADGLEQAADNGLAAEIGGGMSADTMMGSGAMMGGSTHMMGGAAMPSMMTAADIGAMPADAAFAMTTQVCSACHTRFRAEDS